jgi:hypothetical protein
METPERFKTGRPPEPRWDKDLGCEVLRLAYDYRTRTGEVWFLPDNCCDMRACIGRFQAIDAEVYKIQTYVGDAVDVDFRKDHPDGDGWAAYRPRPW